MFKETYQYLAEKFAYISGWFDKSTKASDIEQLFHNCVGEDLNKNCDWCGNEPYVILSRLNKQILNKGAGNIPKYKLENVKPINDLKRGGAFTWKKLYEKTWDQSELM